MTILLFCKWVHWYPCFFKIPHISDFIWYLSFCVWLTSLSMTISMTVHPCGCKQHCLCAQLLNCVWLFVTPWTVACQTLLSMKFSRQEYWSWLLFPTPGDLANPEIEPISCVSCIWHYLVLFTMFFPTRFQLLIFLRTAQAIDGVLLPWGNCA